MNAPKHVYEIYIRTTPEKLWQAITSANQTRQYFYGTAVESEWKVGATVRHLGRNGEVNLDGKVLELVPGKKLVTTFAAVHDPVSAKDRPSRVTWETPLFRRRPASSHEVQSRDSSKPRWLLNWLCGTPQLHV